MELYWKLGAMPLQYTTCSTSHELVKRSVTGIMRAMPLQYTTGSTSRELVKRSCTGSWGAKPLQ
jgi:hypothetical protein